MNKLLAFLLVLSTFLTFSCAALADNTVEFTQEYIDANGIPGLDEYGNRTILIPLAGNANLISSTPAVDNDHTACIPEDMMQARHFSTLGHTHKMINLKTQRGLTKSKPLSSYADEGFTISKEYSKSVTFSMSVDFDLTKADVEREVGMSVGGSYTFGANTSYTSPVVPAGYMGRISYRIKYDLFRFDDEVTYVLNSIPIQYYKETITGCSAESKPYDGCFYLELKAK